MASSRHKGHEHFGTACDARELVDWLRHDRRFDELRRGVLAQLRQPRKGQRWLELGPAQLENLASDSRRAGRLLGHVHRLSLALPKSIRPLLWTLLLNPTAAIEVPSGPALPRSRFEALKELVETALYGWRGLDETERKTRQRLRDPLDPGKPALVLADEWRGPPASVGMDAAINATAMVWKHQVIAGPSQAGHPVHYTVASVGTTGEVVLEPTVEDQPGFDFNKEPL
jgi:hypothetical protein